MAKSTVTYHRRTPCWGDPPLFSHDEDAHHWAVGQGAYQSVEEAHEDFILVQQRYSVATWAHWLTHVGNKLR